MPDLSIIILNYNTKTLLEKCLRSVLKAKPAEFSWEIIVVDNASSDGSPIMVAKQFPQVILMTSQRNLGFSGGNNLGLRRAKGKFVLFLNSDTEVTKDAFSQILCFVEGDKQIGAATPKTMLVSGGMDPDCHRGFPTPWASFCYFSGLEKLFPTSRLFGQYHQHYLDLNQPHQIDAGFGTFMIVRRNVLEQVGGWDESYFFYGEDLDLFYRIKNAGWKVMFYPKVLLYHHKGASSGLRGESKSVARPSRQVRLKAARESVKAMKIFYRKFYRDKYPGWLTWLILSGISVKGALRLVYHYSK